MSIVQSVLIVDDREREEAPAPEQESGEAVEGNETQGAEAAEEAKPQEGEPKEVLDIEAMIAALHSDTATTTSESININL